MVKALTDRELKRPGRHARSVTRIEDRLLCVTYRLSYAHTLHPDGNIETAERETGQRVELFALLSEQDTNNLYVADARMALGLYDRFVIGQRYPDWNGQLLCETRSKELKPGLWSSYHGVIGYGIARGRDRVSDCNQKLGWLSKTLNF